MPLKVFSSKGHSHENKQFLSLITQLYNNERFFGSDDNDWTVVIQGYEFCEQTSEGVTNTAGEIDALIIRPNSIILLETKHYSDTSTLIAYEDKPWLACGPDGAVTVKGGNQANPFTQAEKTRKRFYQHLKKQHSSFFNKHLAKQWKKNRIKSVVWFAQDLTLDNHIKPSNRSWFDICHKETIVDVLNAEHDVFTKLSAHAIGELVTSLNPGAPFPFSPFAEHGYNPVLPGYPPKTGTAAPNKPAKQASHQTTPQFHTTIDPDCKPLRESLPSALVYFPVASDTQQSLLNLRVTVLPEDINEVPVRCNSKHGHQFTTNKLLSALNPAREHELTNPRCIQVSVSNSNIQQNSYQLALAIADQIARHGSALPDHSRVAATGEIGEHGYVSPVSYIESKIRLLLESNAQITHFIYSSDNTNDVAPWLDKLHAQSIKVHAVSSVKELSGHLWRDTNDAPHSGTQEKAPAPKPSSQQLSEIAPARKPSSLWTSLTYQHKFAVVGVATALLVVALVNTGASESNTSTPTQKTVTLSFNQDIVSEINDAASAYTNNRNSWPNLKELQSSYAKASALEVAELDDTVLSLLDKVDKDLSASDRRLQEIKQLLTASHETTAEDWGPLAAALSAIPPLTMSRLELEQPETLLAISDKASAHNIWQLAASVRSASNDQSLLHPHLEKLKSLSPKQQSAFENTYPEEYAHLMHYQHVLQASNQRIRDLIDAAKAYERHRHSQRPNLSYWQLLIEAEQALQSIDFKRLGAEGQDAMRAARRAQNDFTKSDKRLAAFIATMPAFIETRKPEFAHKLSEREINKRWRAMADAANALTNLDLARASSQQKNLIEYAQRFT